MSVGNGLKYVHVVKWRPYVGVDKLSKSSSCEDDEVRDKQMGDDLVVNEETIKIPLGYDIHIDESYAKREWRLENVGRITLYLVHWILGQCGIFYNMLNL